MNKNATLHCLSERQLLLSVDGFERIVFGYIIPFLILFGVIGNLINLTVLLGAQMKTRYILTEILIINIDLTYYWLLWL